MSNESPQLLMPAACGNAGKPRSFLCGLVPVPGTWEDIVHQSTPLIKFLDYLTVAHMNDDTTFEGNLFAGRWYRQGWRLARMFHGHCIAIGNGIALGDHFLIVCFDIGIGGADKAVRSNWGDDLAKVMLMGLHNHRPVEFLTGHVQACLRQETGQGGIVPQHPDLFQEAVLVV